MSPNDIYLMKRNFIMGLELWDKVLPAVKKIIQLIELLLSIIASTITIIQFIK